MGECPRPVSTWFQPHADQEGMARARHSAATVTARVDSVVWAVDRVTFRRIVMNNTFRKRKLYESFIQTVPILQSLDVRAHRAHASSCGRLTQGRPHFCNVRAWAGAPLRRRRLSRSRTPASRSTLRTRKSSVRSPGVQATVNR